MTALLLLTVGATVGLTGNVSAEIDCRDAIVCDTRSVEGETGGTCLEDNGRAVEWGHLEASVTPLLLGDGSVVGRPEAAVFPAGGGLVDRWIVTTCSSIDLRAYGTWETNAQTPFCGQTTHTPCASTTGVWLTIDGDPGATKGSFCGMGLCEFTKSTATDGFVEAEKTVVINQPDNERVRIKGDAVARYYEDQDMDGLWSDDLMFEATASATVSFYIGSTPPL